MNHAFETIDILALDLVTGGADQQQPPSAPNQTSGSGNLGVTVPVSGANVQVGLQGSFAKSRTDYATCVREVRGAGGKPSDIRATCGLPSGQP